LKFLAPFFFFFFFFFFLHVYSWVTGDTHKENTRHKGKPQRHNFGLVVTLSREFLRFGFGVKKCEISRKPSTLGFHFSKERGVFLASGDVGVVVAFLPVV